MYVKEAVELAPDDETMWHTLSYRKPFETIRDFHLESKARIWS